MIRRFRTSGRRLSRERAQPPAALLRIIESTDRPTGAPCGAHGLIATTNRAPAIPPAAVSPRRHPAERPGDRHHGSPGAGYSNSMTAILAIATAAAVAWLAYESGRR